MTIEGLGKKFQEARLARGLTLDEAARMTKIRPSRLAEIEADDFSQFPSLAYAKGFLLIYGKFLDVDVTPYMEAFETSDAMTVDGYSYLQNDAPDPTPVRSPVVRRRPERVRSSPRSSGGERTSIWPLLIAVAIIIVGFIATKFILDVARLGRRTQPEVLAPTASAAPALTAAAPAATTAPVVAAVTPPPPPPTAAPSLAPVATPPPPQPTAPAVVAAAPTAAPRPAATTAPSAAATRPVVAATSPKSAAPEPEVRRAEPVKAEDLAKASTAPTAAPKSVAPPTAGPNRVAIKPLKRTYVKVVVDDGSATPAFERWISPADGVVEFRGQKFSVRLIDRTAVQIKKNGKSVESEDPDVAVED